MSRFSLDIHATYCKDQKEYDLSPLLRLLQAQATTSNLQQVADQVGCSYRTAWNLLKQFEALFGSELVGMQKGRGSQLTDKGKALLDAYQQQSQFLAASLTEASRAFDSRLQQIVDNPADHLKIVASDSVRLNHLRELSLPVSIQIEGSEAALQTYVEGRCDLAGFHLASQSERQWRQYHDLFSSSDQFVLLEQRQQGLMSRQQYPVESLQQVLQQQLTFVNRQAGSGTRLLLDELLQQQGIEPQQVKGYRHEEHTHLAVAGLIASEQSDVGLGVKSAADIFQLHFTPLMNEHYFLVFKHLTPLVLQMFEQLIPDYAEKIMVYEAFMHFAQGGDK